MLFTCLHVKSLWWGAAVKQQEKRMWDEEVWGLSFLQWPSVSQVFIQPPQHPDVTCVFMSEKTDESASAHFHRSLKLLKCFTEVQQKDQHPNKMLCLLLFFMFSPLSLKAFRFSFFFQSCNPLVNAAFGIYILPGYFIDVRWRSILWHGKTLPGVSTHLLDRWELLEKNMALKTLSVSDLFASFSTFDCRHFSELFFFLPSKKQFKYLKKRKKERKKERRKKERKKEERKKERKKERKLFNKKGVGIKEKTS